MNAYPPGHPVVYVQPATPELPGGSFYWDLVDTDPVRCDRCGQILVPTASVTLINGGDTREARHVGDCPPHPANSKET